MRLASQIAVAAVVVVAVTCGAGAAARGDEPAAKAAFQEGERAFQLGKFEDAIAAYERAFSLDPQPAFVFNIALAHRRQYEIDGQLDHLLRARELYRNYLRLDPHSPRRAGVEKLLTELTAKIDTARAAPTVPPAPLLGAPHSPSSPTTSRSSSLVASPSSPASISSPPPPASHRTLYLAGGAAIVAAVALTILLASAHARDPSFDGPPIDLTPR